MEHNIPVIYINVHGVCDKCKQNIANTKAITKHQLDIIHDPKEAREILLQELWDELEVHECSG